MRKIMVTGVGGPASVNVIKSLRLAEEMLIVGTEINKYRIHLSQADKNYIVPVATTTDYIDEMNEIIEENEVGMVLPQPDTEVWVLGENRSRLKAKTFLPNQETIRVCQDKFLSYKKWKENGIPVPHTEEIHRIEDIIDFTKKFSSPYWIRATKGAGGRGSTMAWDLSTATAWINYWRCRGEDWQFIIQEYLPGRNIAFHSLWKEGQLITSMARERLEYLYSYLAPSGVTGTPTIQRTIHDDKVNKIATRAILAVDEKYTGLACCDIKEDKNGVPNPTEINPGRMFTTSLFFSYASHKLYNDFRANFPYLCVLLGYSEKLPELPKYNSLPEELYWIRHIDMGARLVRNDKVIGEA